LFRLLRDLRNDRPKELTLVWQIAPTAQWGRRLAPLSPLRARLHRDRRWRLSRAPRRQRRGRQPAKFRKGTILLPDARAASSLRSRSSVGREICR
jgi:hypothetical protein